MTAQLVLDLPLRTALGRDDFLVSDANADAVGMIEAGGWPQGMLLVTGPAGSGKTHLLGLWAGENDAEMIGPGDTARLEHAARAGTAALALDDADQLFGQADAETALFHLWNSFLARGGRLLIAARALPPAATFVLPDLESRLRSMAAVSLGRPDDALLAGVLVKLFADRQVAVSPAALAWILRRIDRTFGAAQEAVRRLDAAALAEGRPITRAFAAAVLDKGRDLPTS